MAEPLDATRARRTALAVLATCFLLNMAGRGVGDTYAVFLLPLEREFGWSRSQLTGVYSVYLLVNGFAAPLVGVLFDRAGPRWVYAAGLACLGSAFFLAGSLDSLWQFYLLAGAMIGIGVSLTGMVPATALLSRWYRVRLSRMIGVAFSAVGLGVITFVPLTQYVVDHYDWRTAYRALGGLLLLALPFLVLAVPWRRFSAGHPTIAAAAAASRAEGGGWTLARALRTPIYWGMAQAFFFTATGMFAIIVQLVAFLIGAGFSPIGAATAYGITGMLSAFSVMGSGFVAERFGVRQTVTASFAGTAAGMVLLMFLATQPSALLLGAFVVVFGLCMGVRGPIISAVCTRHFAGPRVATIYGTIYACNALGAAFGSLMGGLLLDYSGNYRVVFGFSLCAIALAVMPFWAVRALRDFR